MANEYSYDEQDFFICARIERKRVRRQGWKSGGGRPSCPPHSFIRTDTARSPTGKGENDFMQQLQRSRSGPASCRQVCWLPLSSIVPNPDQPRKEFSQSSLNELASSIRQFGLLQPITVRIATNGQYEIIMGERRFRACQMLGLSHIDAIVLPATGLESAMMALVENLQREDLHFFEEAEAYSALIENYHCTQDDLARRLGKSACTIANKLRLLRLDSTLRALIFEENLSERHARALLRLPDGPGRMRIAQQAAANNLTVRETEALVERALSRLPVPPPPSRRLISLVRDHRLYMNAIKGIVVQMQETGIPAEYSVMEYGDTIELRILMPKRKRRSDEAAHTAYGLSPS